MIFPSRCKAAIVIGLFVASMTVLTSITAEGGEWVHMKRQSPDQPISSLLDMPGGELWAATGDDYYQYDGINWRILEGDREQFLFPYPFISDDDGKVYILDQARLAVLSDGAVRWYDSAGAQAPVTGTFADDGTLYLTSNNLNGKGIYAFDGESVIKINDSRGISVAADHDGRVWATIRESSTDAVKLLCRENDVWSDRTSEVSDSLPPLTYSNNTGATVTVAPDGALWVNNRGKYAVLRDGVWSFGGSGGTPVYIDFDSAGGVWGYNAASLFLLDQSGVWRESRTMTSGPLLAPKFMVNNTSGGIWITDGADLYQYSGGKWNLDVTPYDLASDTVTTLAFTYDGLLLCGHGIRFVNDNENHGISIWDGSQWFHTTQFGPWTVNNVYHLETTPYGTVMAYTDMGFMEYDDHEWTVADSLGSIVDSAVTETDMVWEDYNTLWLSTYSGLIRYNDQKNPSLVMYLPLDTQGKPKPKPLYSVTVGVDGLIYCQDESRNILSFEEPNKIWENVVTNSLHTHDFELDINGLIWGALDDGLGFWNTSSQSWELVTPVMDARKIDIDPEGRIWLSGNGGTGYYSDDVWHGYQELAGVRAADFAFSENGDVAINVRDYSNGDAFNGIYIKTTSTGVEESVPEAIAIEAVNVPNPFNPVTSIRFSLPEAGHAEISVYSASGQLVRSLGSDWYPAGWSSIIWDAGTDDGGKCSSGVYFYRIVTGKASTAGKMLLMR